MPYKKGQKWIAQVRKEGKRLEKVFPTQKEAIGLGSQDAAKSPKRMEREDRHGLLR